jgi:hypothetical protein
VCIDVALTSRSGSQELIDEFWQSQGKKGPPAKSTSTRASAPVSVDADMEESVSAPSKRGRKPAAAKDEDEPMDEDPAPASTKKRAATSAKGATAAKKRKQSEATDDSDRAQYDGMEKHMNKDSWEDIVEAIDTVESQDKGGGLRVYFQL